MTSSFNFSNGKIANVSIGNSEMTGSGRNGGSGKHCVTFKNVPETKDSIPAGFLVFPTSSNASK